MPTILALHTTSYPAKAIVYKTGVIKDQQTAFFRNLCDSCMSVCSCSSQACTYSVLGLGLHLGNSLDWRERTSAHTRVTKLSQKKRWLTPNDTPIKLLTIALLTLTQSDSEGSTI